MICKINIDLIYGVDDMHMYMLYRYYAYNK